MIESNFLIRIVGKEEISDGDLKSLTFLYKELIGISTINLYLNCVYLNHNSYFNIKDLLKLLNINIINFEKMLHNLEKVNLFKTYQKDNEYLIEIKEVLSANAFFDNILFDRLLVSKVENRYQNIKDLLYIKQVSVDEYKDISFKLETNWSLENEKRYLDFKEIKKEYIFPIEHFLKNISMNLFPESLRTYDNLLLITKLADNFGISEDNMRKYLHQAISYSPITFLDKDKLKKICSNNKPEINGEGYNMPNISFLKKLQNSEPSYNDKMLIYNLANDESYNLSTEMINYLLEYALKECNNELRPSFIYTIASNWKRNNVDTIDKAKSRISERKNYQTIKKDDIVSEYDSSNNPFVSEEDLKKYLG